MSFAKWVQPVLNTNAFQRVVKAHEKYKQAAKGLQQPRKKK